MTPERRTRQMAHHPHRRVDDHLNYSITLVYIAVVVTLTLLVQLVAVLW